MVVTLASRDHSSSHSHSSSHKSAHPYLHDIMALYKFYYYYYIPGNNIHRVQIKGTDSILTIILTDSDNFS